MGTVWFVFVMPRSAFGGIYGANAGAGTAIDALIGIDYVLSVFVNGDSGYGTFCFAGAAAQTQLFVDNVCHKTHLRFGFDL